MDYRHELKYFINKADAYVLRQRLSSVLKQDENCSDFGYYVTSLYFDDVYSNSYYQKLDGVSERDKIRIRIYNHSDKFIRLEIKQKLESYIKKESVQISFDHYRRMINNNLSFSFNLEKQNTAVLNKLILLNRTGLLEPVVIVDYLRYAFIDSGDVRITFDYGLSVATDNSKDLFSIYPHYLSVLPEGTVIMEIKYTGFLPSYINSLLHGMKLQYSSISKFILCMDKLKEIRHYA